jgi:hypothetical protein
VPCVLDSQSSNVEFRLRPEDVMTFYATCHAIVPCVFGVNWTIKLDALGRRTHGLPQGPSARWGELLDGVKFPVGVLF